MTVLRWIMRLIGIAALAGIFALCLTTVPQQIQSDLLARAQLLLEEKNMDWVIVSIDGRDITLSGNAADSSDKDIVSKTIATIPGVRVINNRIYTPDSEKQKETDNRSFRLSLAEPADIPDASATQATRTSLLGADVNVPISGQLTSIQYEIGGRN
ncbi:MAG: hypothetical protein ACWA44_10610 [Thiotrichales bacterium]